MTAPNKNEGLIARLEQVEHSYPGLPDVMRNPDGPEAARAIQDLEEEVGKLRGLLERAEPLAICWATHYASGRADDPFAVHPQHRELLDDMRLCLAATADG